MRFLIAPLLVVLASCLAPPGDESDAEDVPPSSIAAVLPPPVVPDWTAVPTTFGFFDHTRHWYRVRDFALDQTAAHLHDAAGKNIAVVLYNDIAPTTTAAGPETGTAADLRARFEARAADIADYLDTAAEVGGVRVLVQLPAELVRRWATERSVMEGLVREFIVRWRNYPALAGFYVFDEPDLHAITTTTLQQIAGLIRAQMPAGRNTVCFSIASSAISENKPILEEYASALPTTYDVLLINRYPVYRQYDAPGNESDTAFEVDKLGLTPQKAVLENLADNEFANVATYHDTITLAAQLRRHPNQVVRASLQSYGLRDDCAGPTCRAVNETNPRRSPTWGELLNMYASSWIVGIDGVVLYSHYFSLYDAAMRRRVVTLERLVNSVFRHRAVRGPGVALRNVSSDPVIADQRPENVYARYVPDPAGRQVYMLVVMHNRLGNKSVRVQLNPGLEVTKVRELMFDLQGNPLPTQTRSVTRDADGTARELQLTLGSYAVRIFELQHL